MRARRKAAALLAAAFLAGVLPAGTSPAVVTATTTRDQITQKEKEKENLQGELGKTNEDLEGLRGDQKALKGELNNLNAQMTRVSENLADLEEQIQKKESEIAETRRILEEARETEKWQQKCMVARARNMYGTSSDNYMNAVAKAQSFSKILNTQDYFEKIAAYDQQKMQEFKENRELIEEAEARLNLEMEELEKLKAAAEAEKGKVSGLIDSTSKAISKYAGEIAAAEKKAREYEAQLKKAEEDLTYLKKKLAEEMAMSLSAANGAWRDISEVSFAEGDRKLLANLIYCEAGGEPYDGQVAVGSVVINRMLSSKFPNTMVGVIYAHNQFAPVASGRLAMHLAADTAATSGGGRCYRAADEAMSGITNVGKCVFFRTPIEGLTGIRIGGHIFY